MTTSRRIVVRGRVQDVGFRWSAVRTAQEHGVAGWVRNLPSGEVEAHVEGEACDVAQVEAWFAHGPSGARVDGKDARDDEPEGASTFEIRR